MRKKLVIALAGLGLALLVGSGAGVAQTDSRVSFGIRPTEAFEDKPETFSYFVHEMEPGASLTDEALAMNDSDVPLNLKLYAADGITAQNAGTTFAKEGQESTGFSRGVNRWLSVSATEVPLEPGGEMVVPFTIDVPSDAEPGHHVAGLVLEAPLATGETLPTGENDTQFAVNVLRRAGVAVVVDVPGPHVAGLEISGVLLRQQDDQGATFVIAVHNTGNIFLKAEGYLRITDVNGEELASIPVKMDTVLPGDIATFQITHPIHLADGYYLLSLILNYEGKTATIEGVRVEVRDGQPVIEGAPEEGMLPPAITNIIPTPAEEGGLPIDRFAALGVPLLILTLMSAMTFIIRRRNRRSLPSHARH